MTELEGIICNTVGSYLCMGSCNINPYKNSNDEELRLISLLAKNITDAGYTKNTPTLVIGKSYNLPYVNNKTVTPIRIVDDKRAIFASTDFEPTPFISWLYDIIDADNIDVCIGKYYRTLEEAIDDTNNACAK